MKKEKPTNNVVNISSDLKEKINEGHILPQVHKLFIKGMKPTIKEYYDKLDDSLFDLAEKAESNDLQSDYFTAMREVRKKKELMVRKFSENIQNVFKSFKRADFNYHSQSSSKNDLTSNSLSLVDENELDQKLAISNMVDKGNTFLHQQLFAFQKRFSLLAGGSELAVDQIPVSPTVIVNSFAETFVHLTISNNIELIMLKLFERSLIPKLPQTYQEINDYLINEGIYPSLKFEIGRKGGSGYQPSQVQVDSNANVPGNDFAETRPQEPISDNNYMAISNAFNNRHSGVMSPNNWPVYEAAVIENVLSTLQLDELKNLNSRQLSLSPIEIKNELLSRLKASDDEDENKKVTQQDEDTIDLVGMLFQFLVEDRNLPHRIQALLAKLQIPYLHVALHDRKLFSHKENNARKLLDTIAQASIGWSEEDDVKNKFINKLEEIVQSILETPAKDLNFSALIKDFNSFHKKHQKRSQILEKRTSEKTLGQERILRAKDKTAATLQQKMKNYSLPKIVSDLLLTPWANVLILAHLRHQNEPEQIEKYEKFIDKLIFVSVKNKKTNATNAQISHVIDLLSHGLRLVAFDEHSIQEKGQELYQLLLKINLINTDEDIQHEFVLPQDAFKVDEDSTDKPEIVHFIADKNFNNLNSVTEHIEDDYFQKAKQIKVGDWVEFIPEKGDEIIRAKLSWISPISHKLLFVNARGIKVTDKSLDELAHDLREKTALVLQQIPLFDRALTAIAKQMNESETKEVKATE
jgi:hypothetical protein